MDFTEDVQPPIFSVLLTSEKSRQSRLFSSGISDLRAQPTQFSINFFVKKRAYLVEIVFVRVRTREFQWDAVKERNSTRTSRTLALINLNIVSYATSSDVLRDFDEADSL